MGRETADKKMKRDILEINNSKVELQRKFFLFFIILKNIKIFFHLGGRHSSLTQYLLNVSCNLS